MICVTDYGSPDCGYWIRYKNGKPRYWIAYSYTPLRECEFCGFISTPKKVQYRNGACSFKLTDGLTPTLCMACWNRFRVLVNAEEEVRQCMNLARKLERIARENRRETNVRRIA